VKYIYNKTVEEVYEKLLAPDATDDQQGRNAAYVIDDTMRPPMKSIKKKCLDKKNSIAITLSIIVV